MIAELRGKISSTGTNLSEKLEDELTGNIFGLLRYIPFSGGLKPLLLSSHHLDGLMQSLSTFDLEYWDDREIKERELTAAEWCRIFEKVRHFGVKHITFSGGESTMRDDIFEILQYASKDFTIGLISNGRNIDKKFLHRLKEFNVLLSISVPGIETFADTTKNDNIDHVLDIFNLCKELNIQTVANIAVTKKNLPELYENIALPIINGATYILLNRFLPGGRGLQNKEYLLSVDEINLMFDIAEEVLSKAGIYGHVGTELPYCIIRRPDKYKYLRISSMCAAAKSFFVIDPSGYIKVCNHSPKRLCRWDEIDSLEKNEYWNKFVISDYIPEMCRTCMHLGTKCDGGCREAAHVFYGNIYDKDPCF